MMVAVLVGAEQVAVMVVVVTAEAKRVAATAVVMETAEVERVEARAAEATLGMAAVMVMAEKVLTVVLVAVWAEDWGQATEGAAAMVTAEVERAEARAEEARVGEAATVSTPAPAVAVPA